MPTCDGRGTDLVGMLKNAQLATYLALTPIHRSRFKAFVAKVRPAVPDIKCVGFCHAKAAARRNPVRQAKTSAKVEKTGTVIRKLRP